MIDVFLNNSLRREWRDSVALYAVIDASAA
jgi:hypothetical protein